MPDGIRIGGAFFEVTADTAPLVQAMERARVASQKSAQAIAAATGLTEREATRHLQSLIRQHQQLEQASQKTGRSFGDLARNAAGFTVAAAGVTTGAIAIHQALSKVAETTQRATQLQFQLTQAYGTSAASATRFANDLAKSSGQSSLAVQEGVARFGVLMRGYGLTQTQTEALAKATLDLAAASGTDTVEAFERMIGVFRDGGESAEKLGLVLNDQSVKAFANLTAEQRKNFEQMDALTKSQIRYTEAMKQASAFQGAAAQKAQEQAGAFANLNRETENLALAFGNEATAGGKGGVIGALASAVGWLANLIERSNEAQQAITDLKNAGQGLTGGLIDAFFIPEAIRQRIEENRARAGLGIAGPDPGMPGGTTGGLSDAAARQAIVAARQREQQAIDQLVERRKRQISDLADAQEQAARRAAKAEDDRIERVIVGLEVERAARLKALDDRERATIKTIEAEGQAEEQRFKDEIDRLEREKKLRIDTAEEAARQAERAIDAEKDRRDAAREIEDRERDDARRAEDRTLEDGRRVEDRVREAAQKREIARLEELRDIRVAVIDDEIEQEERRIQKRLRNIDREADRARAKSEKAVRGIEEEAEAEDERHRQVMRALDDEQDARLAILDTQLKQLDAAEKADGAARRIADIQKRIADAQRAATLARGTGTPEQIAAARGDLTRALRIPGNEIGVANARERLVELAGRGNEAIQKADEELAKAQQDLRDEGVDATRDAERDKLKEAQDAIRKEIDARKRAEDDEARRRKQDLDDEKQAEQDKLKANLDRLEKKKQAAQDASKEEIRLLRESLDEEKDAAEEAIQVARDRFDAETEVLNDRRREEDRFRDDQRLAQDRFREDERQAQDAELARRLQAIKDNLEQERIETEAHYNGVGGILTTTRKAMEDAKLAYQLRLDDAKLKFAEEREAIKAVYTNEAKTGMIDLQNQAKENNAAALATQLASLSSWKEQANRLIDDNAKSWKSLAEAIAATDQAIRNLPTQNGRRPFIRPVDPSSGLPIQGPFPEEGDGPGANPPPVVQPQPAPGIDSGNDEISVDPNRFTVAFGFNKPYTNPFNPAIPNHRGVDLIITGARDNGRGQPVGAFRQGVVVAATIDPNGGNGIIIQADDGKYDRYFHFDEINVRNGQTVKRGQRIGVLGASGTEGFPHLHYEVSRGINGDPQDRLIDPTPYMRGRDSGYLFREPTMTVGLRSGQRNLIAERRPELLIGGRQTASLIGSAPRPDYGAMGAAVLSGHPLVNPSGTSYIDHSAVNFYGLTYEEAERRQHRARQRRSLLSGIRSVRRG